MALVHIIEQPEFLPWEKIYKIHSENLSDDIFNTFGKYTEKRFLRYLVTSKKGLVFISSKEEKIIGFLVIRLKPISMIRFIRKDSFFSFINHIKLNPKILIKLIMRLIFAIKTKTPYQYAEFDYFAVVKKYRGLGIGRDIIKEAEKKIKNLGFKGISTITNNKKLVDFYIKNKNAKIKFKFRIFSQMIFHVVYDFHTK